MSATNKKFKVRVLKVNNKNIALIGDSEEADLSDLLGTYYTIFGGAVINGEVYFVYSKNNSNSSNSVKTVQYVKIADVVPIVKKAETKINGVTQAKVNTSSGKALTFAL